MGSRSSSSSSTQTTTQQYDQRVATTDDSIGIGSGANVSVSVTSPEAFETVEQAVEVFGNLGEGLLSDAFEFVQSAGDFVADFTDKNNDRVLSLIEKRTQAESTTLAQDALRIGLPVVLAGLALWALVRSRA